MIGIDLFIIGPAAGPVGFNQSCDLAYYDGFREELNPSYRLSLQFCQSRSSNKSWARIRVGCQVSDLAFYPPLTAPAVKPATICRCANTVSSSTGRVTISAAAASGPQLNWSNEIML